MSHEPTALESLRAEFKKRDASKISARPPNRAFEEEEEEEKAANQVPVQPTQQKRAKQGARPPADVVELTSEEIAKLFASTPLPHDDRAWLDARLAAFDISVPR